jgi:hypothetical protein
MRRRVERKVEGGVVRGIREQKLKGEETGRVQGPGQEPKVKAEGKLEVP